MNVKRVHKVIGIVLAIPLVAWSLTGIVFLVKPGYDGAYQLLSVKTYPLEHAFKIGPSRDWHEARLLRTVLGYHLLTGEKGNSIHLDPVNMQQKVVPSDADIRRLVEDAIGVNSERYGKLINISGNKVKTSTGVEITLDWRNLSLAQSGSDTVLINNLYKVHYLQWLGRPFL
ncbi:MAG: hypothetical protein OSA77_12600, partial [Halioglobus sp.]|nr:hypothetical protein [Halioglobus sp.]